MTHQNHQTNGASLEDCHTNFFALTDLCGIKWRKFVNGERHNASSDPLDDPILRSYSRCMQADMLCVWRRVQSTKQDQPDPNSTMSFDICTSKIHPPLSLAASKELWIFWYGEEPDLNGLVDTDLLRVSANQTNWNGTWENGLSYECRSLLFKALHNLMERFVLTKDIVRFGKWFVQPCTTNDRFFGKSSQHLSFSFTFFVHGDTVCASIDLREHPAVRQLTVEHLADAAAASAAAQSGQQDVRQRSVILAPFGMAATLTGNSYKATDPLAEKILEDWASFFPLCNKENSDLPPVVEVVSGGHKMYHPSMYVLVTDLDEMENVLEDSSTDPSQGMLPGIGMGSSAPAATASASSLVNPRATPINHISPPTPSACGLVPVSKATPTGGGNGIGTTLPSPSPGGGGGVGGGITGVPLGNGAINDDKSFLFSKKIENKSQPFYETSSNNFSSNANTHAPPQASTEMPERVWQDCITNPISSLSLNTNTNMNDGIKMEVTDLQSGDASMNNNNNNNNNSSSDIKPLWNFVDPTQKAPCTCTRCKKSTGGSRSTSSSSTSSSAAANKLTGGSVRPDKSTRFNRIPFHKRHTTSGYGSTTVFTAVGTSTSSSSTCLAGRKSKNLTIEQCDVDLSKADVDTIPNQRSNTTPGTPHGGGSSYSRTSIGDSMPVPSVGSPGSAAPSPHPNSTLSQPTSVPPADQLMSVISPRPPTSVPTLQQPSTPIDHLLDKNTPAPTPTDQHDNKSITASPYVQPTPSVEPPPSAEGMLCSGPGSVPAPPSVERCTPNSQCGTISVKKFDTTGNVDSGGGGGGGRGSTPSGSIPGTDSQLCNNRCNNSASSAATAAYFNLYKRPKLMNKGIEGLENDDHFSSDMLHDFTYTNAWLDHPVKPFKANKAPKPHRAMRHTNLYDSHTHLKPLMPTPGSIHDTHMMSLESTATAFDNSGLTNNLSNNNILQEHEIKNEPHSGTDLKEKGLTGRNLFTAEGLNPSYNDLDHLFDNQDDETGMQIHTPPDSNKSSNGCTNNIDDLKRSSTTNTSLLNNNSATCNSNNNNSNMIQAEDLTKMFPTPPSHEQHHPNLSPCAIDISMTELTETVKYKQEYSAELGSPMEEKIDDWSYVYMPQQMCKFVGSSKYAPLTNLPSQTLPPLIIPPNSVYKPSWQQPPPQRQQQQQQQHQQQQQQQQHQHQQQQQHQLLQQQQQQQQHQLLQHHQELLSSTNLNNMHPMQMHLQHHHPPPPPPPSSTGSNLLLNQLNCPQAALTNTNNSNNPLVQQMLRGLSPISPASGVIPPPPGAPPVIFPPTGSPMMMNRRTPLHPPPPYEVATSSPSNSSSSYLNKQFNSQEPPQTPSAPGSNASCCIPLPEVSSLVVNILLYDTGLNVFRDHNFDSCTLCVCNADSQKCVGNIRGADSGVYVALPGTSFNPTNSICGAGGSATGGGSNSSHMHGGGNMRMVSAFGGLGSPALMGGSSVGGGNGNGHGSSNNHITGYLDEDPLSCSCGFSAVVNRRLAYKSGLFYEDEMEITGIAEDPAKYKKKPLIALLASLGSLNGQSSSALMPANAEAMNTEQHLIIDLLLDQCTMIQTSSSSIHRALTRHRRKKTKVAPITFEYTDANDIICLALEQARLAFNRMELVTSNGRSSSPPPSTAVSVHKWPYIPAGYTRNNKDIIHIMNSMQPLLQNAFHNKSRSGQKDATYTVSGPLTWRQFHRLAGRASGQCEPQPIPSVTVGYDKEFISVAPFALQCWDKMLLEPYSYNRDIVYLIICPENEYVVNRTKTYFKELSTTYEMCKLGRHTPIKGWDGILTVGSKMDGCVSLDDWLRTLEDVPLAEKIRLYANAFQNLISPYLNRVPNDKTLLNPPESTTSGNCGSRPMVSPMPNSQDPSGMHNNIDKAPSTPTKPETSTSSDTENRDSLNTSATLTSSPLGDPLGNSDDDINPPIIVLYVVEPFTYGCDSPELERIACISLLRCYSELLKSIPESVRSNINIQILSLESILELGHDRSRNRLSDELKCLALNIFSQCRRYLSHASSVKSLTGFGTAANMEVFLKSKDEQNRQAYKMYTPPYILAPMHEKTDKTDFSRSRNGFDQQQFSVMYCNYCMSEDQSWLLATVTDDRGELLEKIIINIDIPNRARRRKAPARRNGLLKLMDFIMGIISQTDQPWRLVIGRIGRIGHGELKSWSWLLSKQNLQKASKQLKDICKQCSLLYPPSILSACLVTLEPDSKLRVMPDQFTPDERFSQISMQNPLSTPENVTCTHILVFPTSAVCQSFQKAFNELNETQVDIADDFMFDLDEDPENPIDVNMDNMDLFWDPAMVQTGMERNSNHGSPDRMEDNRSWQSSSGNNINSSRMPHDAQDNEEVGSVLQQPLAVGYFVSTAPTGRMPSWFWSACPHLEDVCPVFLKTALHLHVPNIQNTDDILNANSHSTANDHPLDSNLTADVLRYVLEGYNALSWLALDSNTHDRLSCLPINVQTLMDLYHLTAAII